MQPDIGVVIARDSGHAGRRPEMVQPFGGADEFVRQSEIDQVSGDRDMVRLPLGKVVGEQIEHLAPVHVFAPTVPVHIANHAFGEQVAALGARHRAQMNVREMGESEQGGAQTDLLSPGH
jgi:hypothetical protein